MRRETILAAAIAAGLGVPVAAQAESFQADTEDTGMSWRALNNQVYNQYRSCYLYPGGEIPSLAYDGPGQVPGGAPPVRYRPYAVGPIYSPAPGIYYSPYPPGY